MNTKAIRTTGETNDHTHTYDDAVSPGRTSENDGHTHRYTITEEGVVTIGTADGHTHSAGSARGKSMELESKTITVPFEIKQFSEDERFFKFEGYASTFGNVDRGGDIVVKGAFKDSIKDLKSRAVNVPGTDMQKLMPALWQHDCREPIGSFVEMEEDDRGLFVKGILPKDDDLVRGRVMPQMKAGSVSDMSIGFLIEELSFEGEDEDIVRKLKKIQLFETSLVTIPMNTEANITEFKSAVPFQDLPLADRNTPWDAEAAIKRINEFTGAKEYRKAFLWFEDFDNCKLPVADIIDGKLTVIPRGIFAAAAALSGARGGVEFPDSDRKAIINNVDKYYSKMGLESPFKKAGCFRIDDLVSLSDDLSSLTERELEKLLKSGVSFEGENARTVVSALKTLMRDADKSKKRDADKENTLELPSQKVDELLTLLEKINGSRRPQQKS